MPHPEHEQKPVTDVVTAPTGYSAIGTSTTGQGLSAGAGGGGFWIPPDTTGAVGTTEYVQWVNAAFAVYDKATGLPKSLSLADPSIKALPGKVIWRGFGGGCETNNDGDPIVQFDKLASRWVMTQFSVSTKPYLQCIAISSTPSFTDSLLGIGGATFYR